LPAIAPTLTTDLRDRVSGAEWQTRLELAAAYRLVVHFGWDDLIFTHISAKVPGPEHHFLINPYGLLFSEITASNLVKIDLEANIVEPTPYFVNPAGFTIHSAIHAAREDAKCVMHLHTVAGVAVSCQEHGLLPIHEGVALDHDERPRLVADLGDKDVMLLRNHGTLTVGGSVPEAFLSMYFFERSCATQIAALAGGAQLHWPAERVQEVVKKQAGRGSEKIARLAWDPLVRMLDAKHPDYKN